MTRSTFPAILFIILSVSLASSVGAKQAVQEIPTFVQVQAELRDGSGQPRSGQVVLVISLFRQPTDTVALWSELQTVTLDANGRYAVVAGATLATGIPEEHLRSGDGRWIGVAVQGEAEHVRVQLVSVAYAVRAKEAEQLSGGLLPADLVTQARLIEAVREEMEGGKSSSSGATSELDGPMVSTIGRIAKFSDTNNTTVDSVMFESSGNIGIGTTSPDAKLRVSAGDVKFDNNRGFSWLNKAGTSFHDASATFFTSTDDTLLFNVRSAQTTWGFRFRYNDSTEVFMTDKNGNFGIGTATPSTKLHVNGAATVDTSLSVGSTITGGAGSHSLTGSTTGQNAITVRNTNSGSGASANVYFGNDATSVAAEFGMLSSNYTNSGIFRPNTMIITSLLAGGISLAARGSSSDLRLYAQGATTFSSYNSNSPTEFMRIDSSGNVGIGTTSPSAKLTVAGDVSVSGNIAAKYQDVAEWVDTPVKIDAGTVVIIDPNQNNNVVPSTTAYDTRVAGAVSRQPGLVLGEATPNGSLVAQSGRVRIKADAGYGSIKIGDLLVTSPTAGYAMVSKPIKIGGVVMHRPGTLLGKALEALPNGKGEILVLLTLQ